MLAAVQHLSRRNFGTDENRYGCGHEKPNHEIMDELNFISLRILQNMRQSWYLYQLNEKYRQKFTVETLHKIIKMVNVNGVDIIHSQGDKTKYGGILQ